MQKEFFEELDKISQDKHKILLSLFNGVDIDVVSVKIIVKISDEPKKRFGLNDDISFLLKIGDTGKMKYLYKGIEIEPIKYYIRPSDYHEVSTLTILQEAIKQDTYKPDIMFLERGEKSNT